MGNSIIKSVIINDLVYEMFSNEKSIDDYGKTTLFYITIKKKQKPVLNPIDIGNNKSIAMTIFNLIEINQVHPVHIIDVITDLIS